MSTQSNSALPAYRLGFAPRTGRDDNGQSILGYPIEIGAVFHRKDRDKGLVAKFAIVPEGLKDGALFLMPVRQESDLAELPENPAPATSRRSARRK